MAGLPDEASTRLALAVNAVLAVKAVSVRLYSGLALVTTTLAKRPLASSRVLSLASTLV